MMKTLALVVVTLAIALPAGAQTFTRDVAPILYRSCTSCHRPGEIGPMSLLSYRDARPWAKAIASRVSAGAMPPWHADPAIGDAGNWEVRIPLDERILPDTTLYLSLSRFWLSLRFDTRGIETRQLLFDHSAMLERELASLLNAWGTPRDIELTVW